MEVTLASFYAPRPQHHLYRDYLPLLNLQKRSCDKYNIQHVVLSDQSLPNLKTVEMLLPESLMQASLCAQRDYLLHRIDHKITGHLILCDADGVLGQDPAPIFDGTFDVGVTVHPFYDSILNNGAMFISAGAEALAAEFWTEALDMVSDDNWGDDQSALRDAFQATLDLGVRVINGARVKFFPCVGYNEAPDSVDHDIRPVFVHFRGPRKDWAAEWCQKFLNL